MRDQVFRGRGFTGCVALLAMNLQTATPKPLNSTPPQDLNGSFELNFLVPSLVHRVSRRWDSQSVDLDAGRVRMY